MTNMDAALSWLAAEHANLVAMTAATDGWQLACVLRTYFEHRGHFADWRTTHERALRNAEPDPLGTTLIRFNMGALAMWTGRLVEGMDHFHHALACNVNDQQLVATALTSLGMLAHLLHRDVEAAGYLRQALAIDHDNPRTTALGWNNLGLAEGRLGQRDAALEHHRRALALARQIGSRTAERAILLGLGETSLRLGLPAAQPFRQARELARAGRFRIQEALALDGPVVVIVGRGALSAMKRGVTDCDGRCEVVGRESRYRRGKDLFEVGAGVPPPTDRLHQHPPESNSTAVGRRNPVAPASVRARQGRGSAQVSTGPTHDAGHLPDSVQPAAGDAGEAKPQCRPPLRRCVRLTTAATGTYLNAPVPSGDGATVAPTGDDLSGV